MAACRLTEKTKHNQFCRIYTSMGIVCQQLISYCLAGWKLEGAYFYNAKDCSSHFGLRNVWLDLIAACGPHGPHGAHLGNKGPILRCCGVDGGVAGVLLGGSSLLTQHIGASEGHQ